MRFRTFRHGFGPFGFRMGWWGPLGLGGLAGPPFGRRRAYLRWLRHYKSELEEELRDVEDELRELEREEPKGEETQQA